MQNSIKLALASILVGTIGMTAMPQASYGSIRHRVAHTSNRHHVARHVSKLVTSGSAKPTLISKKTKAKFKKAKFKKMVKLKKIAPVKSPMIKK